MDQTSNPEEHPGKALIDASRDTNVRVLSRIQGVATQVGTPETDADPRNPNKQPEDYWLKAYRLADELRRHLATRPETAGAG